MKVDLGISAPNTQKIVGLLNTLLADEHVLYIKTRNFHWNVVGPSFKEYHTYFEQLYTELAEKIDETAERIQTLGHDPIASMGEFLQHTRLSEDKAPGNEPLKMVQLLYKDHESIIRWLRESIETPEKANDPGTTDFMTSLLEYHEKTAWMLRSYLQ